MSTQCIVLTESVRNLQLKKKMMIDGITALEEFEGGDETNPATNSEAASSEEVDEEL